MQQVCSASEAEGCGFNPRQAHHVFCLPCVARACKISGYWPFLRIFRRPLHHHLSGGFCQQMPRKAPSCRNLVQAFVQAMKGKSRCRPGCRLCLQLATGWLLFPGRPHQVATQATSAPHQRCPAVQGRCRRSPVSLGRNECRSGMPSTGSSRGFGSIGAYWFSLLRRPALVITVNPAVAVK